MKEHMEQLKEMIPFLDEICKRDADAVRWAIARLERLDEIEKRMENEANWPNRKQVNPIPSPTI